MASTLARQLTLADLLQQFGPIAVARIRTNPAPGSATKQDVIDLEEKEDRLYELVDGVLVEKVMGHYESFLTALLVRFLGNFAAQHDYGYLLGADGMLSLFPDQVRTPDVAFISWDRLPNRAVPREPIPHVVPDLAVEVISRGNTKQEMDRKLNEYFDAGVGLVWYIYPDSSSVRAFTSATSFRELGMHDILDGGDVLPGFELPLEQLFNESRKREDSGT